MKKKIIFLLILCLFMPFAHAEEVNQEEKFIAKYGINVHFNNDTNGSILGIGNKITTTKKIDGTSIFIANEINTNNTETDYPYSEYFIAIANKINISTYVSKDAVIIGNNININTLCTINRDVIIIGNNVKISGSLARDAVIYASKVEFNNARIQNDINVYAKEIVVLGNTDIRGQLKYSGNAKLEIAKTINVKTLEISSSGLKHKLLLLGTILFNIVVINILLIICVPKLPIYISKSQSKKTLLGIIIDILTGLIGIIAIPLIILLLLISSIGVFTGIILGFIYIFLLLLSLLLAIYFVAMLIWNKFIRVNQNPYLIVVIGSIIFILITFIPYSILFILTYLCFGFGIIMNLFIENFKKNRSGISLKKILRFKKK